MMVVYASITPRCSSAWMRALTATLDMPTCWPISEYDMRALPMSSWTIFWSSASKPSKNMAAASLRFFHYKEKKDVTQPDG